MIPVTIQRSKWSHGDLVRNALLVDEQTLFAVEEESFAKDRIPVVGTKCCLGFVCNVLGVKDEDMGDKGMPDNLHEPVRALVADAMLETIPYGGGAKNQLWVDNAQVVNDAGIGECLVLQSLDRDSDEGITLRDEAHREELITQIFKVGGFAATFVDA